MFGLGVGGSPAGRLSLRRQARAGWSPSRPRCPPFPGNSRNKPPSASGKPRSSSTGAIPPSPERLQGELPGGQGQLEAAAA